MYYVNFCLFLLLNFSLVTCTKKTLVLVEISCLIWFFLSYFRENNIILFNFTNKTQCLVTLSFKCLRSCRPCGRSYWNQNDWPHGDIWYISLHQQSVSRRFCNPGRSMSHQWDSDYFNRIFFFISRTVHCAK